jgi:hypothetical protein
MGKGQRDIWRMDSVEDGDWFGTNVSNVLGGVKDIRFWKQKWIRMLREALFHKGIINNNIERCWVLCFREEENTHHNWAQVLYL